MPTADYSIYHQANGTTSDGSKFDNFIDAVQASINGLDNNNIAALAGIDASKIAAAYSTYVPTWTASGVAPAIGNATVIARYLQIGKLVHAYGHITFGSTSTFGTGSYSFALPVTAGANAVSASQYGWGMMYDSSAAAIATGVEVFSASATTLGFHYGATYLGTITVAAAAAPWTWAQSDEIKWNILYEAA